MKTYLPAESQFNSAIRDKARRFELKITESGQLTFGADGARKEDLIIGLVTSYDTARHLLLTGAESDGFRDASLLFFWNLKIGENYSNDYASYANKYVIEGRRLYIDSV